jgi:hypothetical protein
MMSCILAFYCAVATAAPVQGPQDPDALYARREQPGLAQQAADIWAARAASGRDFEASWKLARACYWLGTQGPEASRRDALQRGIAAAEQALQLSPKTPEGHFWVAANMGGLAESFGLTQGIKYRGRIKDELLKALAIDPAWEQGSADRALGWWYHMVPSLFGGSEADAETHLRKALTYNAASTATLYFLGEVQLERGKKSDARVTLQKVLDAPLAPGWEPEDRNFKKKAQARLATLK